MIKVKYIEVSSYSITEDGYFKCDHEYAEVTPPCCSGVDSDGLMSCGCGGVYSVYCSDCKGEDITEDEVNDFVEAYLEGRRVLA